MKFILSFIVLFITSALCYQEADIVSARLESCRGCSLNRLPEVKQFVLEDAPLYDRVEVKFISGAVPELIVLGENDKELERIQLSQLNRQECNDVLQMKGFIKISSKSDL